MRSPNSVSTIDLRLPRLPLPALVLAALLGGGARASAQATYTFESLTVHGFIGGQDNWVDKPGQGQAAIWPGSGVNGTKVVGHVPTVAFDESAYIARANDGTFSFPAIFPSHGAVIIQFDCTGDHIALFALGADLDGDGILAAGEIGPAFGTDDRNFRVEMAGFGTATEVPFGSGNGKDDWYRIRLDVDLVANGGDGSGSLSYRNLSDGDPDFIPVAGLQDLDLGLGAMNPAATPVSWNTMWLHLRTGGGNIPYADNLVPNVTGFGAAYCFCEVGPCQNDDELAGCANSTGVGASLAPGGSPSRSSDDLTFTSHDLPPGNSALLFVGRDPLNGGAGIVFGDGLRCAGGAIVRLGVQTSDALGSATWGPGLAVKGGWSSGDVRRFQGWYRDPVGGPCGNAFNLTHGVELTFEP